MQNRKSLRVTRRLTSTVAGLSVLAAGFTPAAVAQDAASGRAMFQATYNALERVSNEGYTVENLDGVPEYTTYLRDGETQQVRVNIPTAGDYILVIGGDNDTNDLDAYFSQINSSDTSYGPTAFFDFTVTRPGDFTYEIDMLDCSTPNCGVYAVLLRVGN